MARKPAQKSKQYGICVRYPDGTIGWLIDNDSSVLSFPTPDEAMKALKRKRKDTRYSWNCDVAVGEIPPTIKK